MADRTLTQGDAEAIADEITGRSREGRLEAGRRSINDAIRGQRDSKRSARFSRIAPRGEENENDDALASARKEREDAEADRARYEAERDAARAEIET